MAEQIKKQWLIAALLALALQIFKIFTVDGPSFAKTNATLFDPFFFYGAGITIAFSLFYLTYYLAYKKKGTAFLLFQLIYIPFSLITNFSRMWYMSPNLPTFLYIISLPFTIFIYLWIMSYKLYKFNSSQA